ncbi:uncharacterized protein LOC141677706 [Apium graveolens]|uniref:uncharacterized protein LOC141677706 n=1 Tax=Apium graveolens TaxID=4045 RepID=UPI003D7B1F6F
MEQKVNVRVLLDKVKNKVVFVEAGGDFVDILLSFLTLPMAKIIRLINTCHDGPPLGKLGSLCNLYQSLLNIDPVHLSGDQCKDMLITPRNQSEVMCKKLKINIDNAEQLSYFLCRGCCSGLSTKKDTMCSCGDLMNKKIEVKEDSDITAGEYEGVFVTASASFLVTDDLCIRENSVRASVDILSKLGIKDIKKIDSLSRSFGLKEISPCIYWELYHVKPCLLSATT